ncbi:MAG: hypothetical protein HUU47_09810 [Bacteroidetes bacterium]|nr:hypothetical protein [Bacteroidota bacterium]
MNTKNILILTYYWPPSGGGGVQRWMYFSVYLSKLGFNPTVVTVNPQKASYPLIDHSQTSMVKDIETIYTDTLEPFKIYSLLKSGKKSSEIPYGNLGSNNGGVFSKIMAFVRANFFIPDARKGWVKFAVKASTQILKNRKFDWLITTGPPHSTHLAGLYLSEKFKIKWLADFRDPWTEIYFLNETYRMKIAVQKDLKLEKLVLNKADLITTVGPSMGELLLKKIEDKSKLKVLFNGYDSQMFDEIERKKEKNEFFTISHIGLLGKSQSFGSYVKALIMSGIDLSKIKIHLAGNVHSEFIELLKSNNINYVCNSFLPRKDALTLMKNSDMLLLCPPMAGETKIIISTKSMEYLAAGVPVWGIGDTQSDAAMLVKKQSYSGFFAPENISESAEFLEQSFKNWENNVFLINDFNPEQYSRYAVSKQLAELLNTPN